MSEKKWLQRYVYIDLHEIFFGEFLNILTEWLERLVEKTRRFKETARMNWTPKLIIQLNDVSNLTNRAFEFWLDSILGGYITEFTVDCIQSYNVAERDFFKVLCGRFLK
jgi:hypothetical protein